MERVMAGKTTRLRFWAPEAVMDAITARGDDLSDTIREGLSRYYVLLETGRSELKGVFAQGELWLMLDLCNGTRFEQHSVLGGIAANCADGEDMYYEKWKCQRKPLLAKLKKLKPHQEAALVDAIERWWKRVGEDKQPEIEDLLK